MEFSTFIGKPVLSPAGENYGYTKCVYLSKDLSKLSCLLCVDCEEEEFIIPAAAVQSVGDIIIAGKARLSAPTGVPCPVGKAVYDEHGTFLGGASALTDGKNGILSVVGTIGTREFAASQTIVGETVIVRYGKTSVKKPRAPRKPRKTVSVSQPESQSYETVPAPLPESQSRETVSAPLPEPQSHETVPTPLPKLQSHETVSVPQLESQSRETVSAPLPEPQSRETVSAPLPELQWAQANSDYRLNLLGRRVRRTVTGLAVAGETVTAKMLQRARESNRLLELTAGILTK